MSKKEAVFAWVQRGFAEVRACFNLKWQMSGILRAVGDDGAYQVWK